MSALSWASCRDVLDGKTDAERSPTHRAAGARPHARRARRGARRRPEDRRALDQRTPAVPPAPLRGRRAARGGRDVPVAGRAGPRPGRQRLRERDHQHLPAPLDRAVGPVAQLLRQRRAARSASSSTAACSSPRTPASSGSSARRPTQASACASCSATRTATSSPQRGADEGIDDLQAAKIRNAMVLYQPLRDIDGIEFRLHRTVLYNSIYRADDQLLVNTHIYGFPAAARPGAAPAPRRRRRHGDHLHGELRARLGRRDPDGVRADRGPPHRLLRRPRTRRRPTASSRPPTSSSSTTRARSC